MFVHLLNSSLFELGNEINKFILCFFKKSIWFSYNKAPFELIEIKILFEIKYSNAGSKSLYTNNSFHPSYNYYSGF